MRAHWDPMVWGWSFLIALAILVALYLILYKIGGRWGD